MSWFTDIESFFKTTETDVQALLVKIAQGVQIVETDINNALRWAANNAPAIAADIQGAVKLVEQIGIITPEVQTAITAANASVVALNAFAASVKHGETNAQSVVSAYVAVKNAQKASANAAAAAANAINSSPAIAGVPVASTLNATA